MFLTDDKNFNEKDLSRSHVLTGYELEKLKRGSMRVGFYFGILVFITGVLLVWTVRYLLGV